MKEDTKETLLGILGMILSPLIIIVLMSAAFLIISPFLWFVSRMAPDSNSSTSLDCDVMDCDMVLQENEREYDASLNRYH